MKKVLLGAAGIVLLLAAGLVAFGLYRKHQGHDVRGSSTEEFVTTQAAPKTAAADGEDPLADVPLRPDPPGQRREDARPAAVQAALVLPRRLAGRVPAGGRVRPPLLRQREGRPVRRRDEARAHRLGLPRPPLHRRLAGGRQPHRLHDLPEQAALQRDPLRARRRGGRAQRRHRQAALAPEDRADRVVAARARRGRLRRRLERPRLRAERRLGRDPLDLPDRRQDQGRRRLLGRPRLLRLLRPPRLRA